MVSGSCLEVSKQIKNLTSLFHNPLTLIQESSRGKSLVVFMCKYFQKMNKESKREKERVVVGSQSTLLKYKWGEKRGLLELSWLAQQWYYWRVGSCLIAESIQKWDTEDKIENYLTVLSQEGDLAGSS